MATGVDVSREIDSPQSVSACLQNPKPSVSKWSVKGWLQELTLEHLAQEILPVDNDADGDELDEIAHLDLDAVEKRLHLAHPKTVQFVISGLKNLREGISMGSNILSSKFVAGPDLCRYAFGTEDQFYGGLDSYIGRPKDPAIFSRMEWEHCKSPYSGVVFTAPNYGLVTTPCEEWDFVIFASSSRNGGTGAHGERLIRRSVPLEDLLGTRPAKTVGLTKAEVSALRLYTGPLYCEYNAVLRDPKKEEHKGKYLYTVHAISSGVIKLSRIQPVEDVWRGLSGGVVPESFLVADAMGAKGGIDFGLMSTTTDRDIAMFYASSRSPSIVFRMRMGVIDRGADISWLSQYPTEKEILFPPLTSLEVVGNPRIDGRVTVFTLRPNINTKIQTVDELVAKSKKMHLDSIEFLFEEAKNAVFPFNCSLLFPDYTEEIKSHLDAMQLLPVEWYNSQENYRNAVNAGLAFFEGTIIKPKVLNTLMGAEIEEPFTTAHGDLIAWLRGQPASEFADPKFVQKYVACDSMDAEGSYQFQNYLGLWRIPLISSGWRRLVMDRSCSCVRVHGESAGLVLRCVRLFATTTWSRNLLSAVASSQLINDLAGPVGRYLYIAKGQKYRPIFYNPENGKYVYSVDGAWYVGNTVGSLVADLRSCCDVDHPSGVEGWERRKASGLSSVMRGNVKWIPTPDIKVQETTSGSLGKCKCREGEREKRKARTFVSAEGRECVHVCECVCAHIYTHICIYIYIHTYICVYVLLYNEMCVC